MRGRVVGWAVVVPLLGALGACAGGAGGEVQLTVSAASSLGEALAVVARDYEALHPGVRLRLNTGSSGTLQRQIERGAPVDVFLSASPREMDALQAAGVILSRTRLDVAGNELVLVVPAAAPEALGDFEDLARPAVRRVAIGAPAAVPAGRYALQVLEAVGVAGAVMPKAVQGQNVRQVLGYVELGEVDAGIVYRSDAHSTTRVRVVATAPAGSHEPIVYPAAVVAGTPHPEEAARFVDDLRAPRAAEVLRRFGFRPAH